MTIGWKVGTIIVCSKRGHFFTDVKFSSKDSKMTEAILYDYINDYGEFERKIGCLPSYGIVFSHVVTQISSWKIEAVFGTPDEDWLESGKAIIAVEAVQMLLHLACVERDSRYERDRLRDHLIDIM